MTIYADVVFMENMAMNYIILFATGIINKVKIKPVRIGIASLLGSLYAVMYLTILGNLNGIAIKILLSLAMIYIAFKPENFKKFLKQLLIFYLTSFTFGGVAFALLYFIRPQDILMKNGVYIGTYPIKIALLGGTVGFVIITIAFNIIKGKISKKDMFCNVELNVLDSKENITAMLDTGNMLKEPITGNPVIVVEKDAIARLIPEQILDNMDTIINGQTELNEEIGEYINKFRIIPFASLGKKNGLLLGIKADYIKLEYNEQELLVNNAIIGIYNDKLCKNNTYQALIGLDMIDERGVQNEYFGNVKV